MSQLDDLLERIDPKKTIDHGNALLDKALNSYHFAKSQVESHDEFKQVCGDFYWHVESTLLGVGSSVSPNDQMKQGFALGILGDIFGKHNTDAAYQIARSGVEGGLYGVLRKMGEAMAKKHVDTQIGVEVSEFVNQLMKNLPEFHATVEEYAQKYGRLLPREALEDNAFDIKIGFWKVLQNHPYMVKSMREIGKL